MVLNRPSGWNWAHALESLADALESPRSTQEVVEDLQLLGPLINRLVGLISDHLQHHQYGYEDIDLSRYADRIQRWLAESAGQQAAELATPAAATVAISEVAQGPDPRNEMIAEEQREGPSFRNGNSVNTDSVPHGQSSVAAIVGIPHPLAGKGTDIV